MSIHTLFVFFVLLSFGDARRAAKDARPRIFDACAYVGQPCLVEESTCCGTKSGFTYCHQNGIISFRPCSVGELCTDDEDGAVCQPILSWN